MDELKKNRKKPRGSRGAEGKRKKRNAVTSSWVCAKESLEKRVDRKEAVDGGEGMEQRTTEREVSVLL
ncbi:MAG: hypothetical protein Q8P67_25615 [archaeon]|nr:hypothetical protein [archaeon]